MGKNGITLGKACQVMMDFAPLRLAEEWDNVGLLVEPDSKITVKRIMLTIDLTEMVMDEAIEQEVGLIIAYHPPLFIPLKRITQSDARSRSILKAIRAGIPIYSPHTALDHVEGGVNDWLADGLGEGDRAPINFEDDRPGTGRLVTLNQATPLPEICERLKQHLGLDALRVAEAERHRGDTASPITTIALCAGAGASCIGITNAQIYLTGEMRHHDVLRANEAGTTVILCEHTNTERGFLPVLQQRLEEKLPQTEIIISKSDREPLEIK